MAASVLVDAGFLIALIDRRENHHGWAASLSNRRPPPWHTCDAVISEALYLAGEIGFDSIMTLLRTTALLSTFHAAESMQEIVQLLSKYADVPMSFADACLVRMTEIMPDPVLLTADSDFRIYRRHGRQIIPTVMPE
jgi:uncharacterized protein